MKFMLFQVLIIGAVLGISSARTLEPAAKSPRTYGNFGPTVKQTFEIEPATLFKSSLVNDDPISIATLYIALDSNVAPNSVRVSASHKNDHNGVTHVYLQQVLNDVDIVNGVANVNVDSSGKIISVGNSFFKNEAPVADFAKTIIISASEAILSFAELLNVDASSSNLLVVPGARSSSEAYVVSGASFAVSPISAELKYIQVEDGLTLAPVWELLVETKENMYDAFVDATNGELLCLNDWVSDATYNVFPLGTNDPASVSRVLLVDPASGGRVLLVDPANTVASPLGWHSQGGGKDYTSTISNNVFAQNNPTGGTAYLNNARPDGGPNHVFDYQIDYTKDPSTYVNASTTNLFYWNNIIHDLFYVHGFNELAGNFQQNNLGLGGKGNDAVVAFAQDGSGTDNANFMTPPDGQQGRMRMYVWTQTNPRRDGDLDGGIVMHEYAHGISNRLTGGPANVNCLGSGEAGGMGEGWGDFFATITRTTATSTRNDNYAMGAYDMGNPAGIRNYLYSTNMATNPSTYGYLGQTAYSGVHAIGEVWAVILYECFWNLVEKHGFDSNWFNSGSTGGNVIMLQLVVDGLKLQPCNPKFTNARDAIIQADQKNNNGNNACELWRGFAKRGLGYGAVAGSGTGSNWKGTESFVLPPAVCQP